MAKRRQYTTVSDVLADIAPDDTFRADFDEHVARRGLVKALLSLRAVNGLSQRDIAQSIGCTQSRISKLENANDDDVRLGDLKAYAKAVCCDLVVQPVPQEMKPTDKVKCHAFAIKKHMDDLALLAKADEQIAEGVAGFFYEVFVNVFLMMGDSAQRLPLRRDKSPYFQMEMNSIKGAEDVDLSECVKSEDVSRAAVS